jgi:hypothetical protein
MATIFTDTPKLGVDILHKVVPGNLGTRNSHRLGSQAWGTDGKRYVYAQAGASISASTAVCAVNTTTFIAAATGGSYKSPPEAMATGDQGWFGAASV